MASPGHGHVELRIIGMGEGSDRNADNDLVDGFALGCMRCDANTLINVKRTPGDYLPPSTVILPSSIPVTVSSSLLRNLRPAL